MTTEAGNKLIAEFMGYVQSEEHNVHLHSVNFGFKGSNGYSKPFIKKDQYDLLIGLYESGQQTEIDKFYESTRSATRLPYIFNGVHLFLTGWNNRTTKLDWMPCKLKYHEDWNKLMPVVEKIESLKGIVTIKKDSCEIQYKFGGIGNYSVFNMKIDAVWNACVKYIHWYNNQPKV
jgi:WD40 repeat protein